jgi:hypothetical protein
MWRWWDWTQVPTPFKTLRLAVRGVNPAHNAWQCHVSSEAGEERSREENVKGQSLILETALAPTLWTGFMLQNLGYLI